MSTKRLTTQQAMRYSRQILLSGFDLDKQEVLINSSALVIGVGGLGCAAAQYLVAAGIGSITLVDDDTVETTNLQRQILHYESSIGSKKVYSAHRTLNQINSHVDVHTIDHRLTQEQLEAAVLEHDIVLDCCDNLATRNSLNDVCYKQSTALVSGAAIRMEGQVFCVLPKQLSACYRCVSHFFGEQNLSCVESGVMSPVVGIIGAMQANEAIKILCDYGQASANRLQLFDALNSEWQSINVPRLQDCPCCKKVTV